ncbi:sensor histidine kinase [Marinifilum caeruleilacunae]|uniref:histidine kinase n=1 Tax=Marinifilum caeruleilacunae TaxID=2499076 RepID=A0ABX1WV19_9BACT|nr:HAMP domain-containing sensor histidine kinase [Marinifilum caeruleilacunae]NOU59887.1 HAMP domain-containing histidine kinase [Marinifilum caeruleilacunae]
MKLLTKINRNYLKYGSILFLAIDLIVILLVSYLDRKETLHELRIGATEVVDVIKYHGHFPNIPPIYTVEEIDSDIVVEGVFKDTIMFDPEDQHMDDFLEYRFSSVINGTNYLITHRHRTFTYPQLFLQVTLVITGLLLIIFLALLFYTRIMSRQIWGVFERNSELLNKYSFASPDRLVLEKTNIDEFDGLNQVLEKMSDRLSRDYLASKEFSANAAHELQTPLAIIRNKCEDLLSESDVKESAIHSIHDIYKETDRLSGITKALLLLAKIDHGQFNEEEKICMTEIIREKLDFYAEVIEEYDLKINLSTVNDCMLFMDKRLAILWVQNILVNAIKNSPKSKELDIILNGNKLSVSNFGDEAIQQPEQIFNRFYKENRGKESSGIGLAIVKKIADHYQMNIKYSFKDFKHTFTFEFPAC